MIGIVLSCEHAGYDVPPAYRYLFESHEQVLHSHRGWDPGALALAKPLAQRLGVPLHATTVTRLLVDNNRSRGHRQLFSEFTRRLDEVEQNAIVARYYSPHRQRVADAVRLGLKTHRRVIHLAIHSFTPVLGGEERRFDIGWLYDSRRANERQLADALIKELGTRRRDLRQRRNAPYLGRADGLTTALRRRHDPERYLGLELEINQRLAIDPPAPFGHLIEDLGENIAATLRGARPPLPMD